MYSIDFKNRYARRGVDDAVEFRSAMDAGSYVDRTSFIAQPFERERDADPVKRRAVEKRIETHTTLVL